MSNERRPAGSGEVHDRIESELLSRPGARDHIVQFYEDDGFLCCTVAGYVGSGLERKEPSVLIATAEHRDAIGRALRTRGFDVEELSADERLVMLDARESLECIRSRGALDESLFKTFVGERIRRSSRRQESRSVRAFGEMVELLWREGQVDEALQLERLWNELAREASFSLLCAYSMNAFAAAGRAQSFGDVCSRHSHVLPREDHSVGLDADSRLRAISTLQRRAEALEAESAVHARNVVSGVPFTVILPLAGARILLVEDDPDARTFLLALLGEQGAVTEAVTSAAYALDAIATRRPQILVSDIGLPGRDGYALIKEVRALEKNRGPRLPAVALSGFASRDDVTRALAAGYDAHVAKPVDFAVLCRTIAKLCASTGGSGPSARS